MSLVCCLACMGDGAFTGGETEARGVTSWPGGSRVAKWAWNSVVLSETPHHCSYCSLVTKLSPYPFLRPHRIFVTHFTLLATASAQPSGCHA